MNVQQLLTEIEKDAHEKAYQYRLETRKSVKEFEEETAKLLKNRRVELYKEVERKAQEQRIKEQSRAELEARRVELKERRELLEKAFVKAKKSLEKLSATKRKQLLEALWKNTIATTKVASIEVAKKDRAAMKGRAKITKTIDSTGGFVAHTQNATIDCTFETLLERVKEECIDRIAKVLFT